MIHRRDLIKKFVENIERERVRMGLTQAQMAQKLEMSASGYKKMISGETSRIDLYTAYLAYRLTGRMIFDLCGDHTQKLSLIRKIGRLSHNQHRFVEDVVDFELTFPRGEQNGNEFIDVMVPTGNMDDGMIWDSINMEKVNAAPYIEMYGSSLHCGIRITSNHLHPVYHIGDILLVCRKSPRDGDTGIFVNRENGCAYIRKFYQTNPYRLEPINDQGVTFYINGYDDADMSKWINFGYVLAKMRD